MNELMNEMMPYLPILVPIIILELSLTIAALIHVLTHKSYKFGNRPFWIFMSFIQIIGPIVYFIFGRGDE